MRESRLTRAREGARDVLVGGAAGTTAVLAHGAHAGHEFCLGVALSAIVAAAVSFLLRRRAR